MGSLLFLRSVLSSYCGCAVAVTAYDGAELGIFDEIGNARSARQALQDELDCFRPEVTAVIDQAVSPVRIVAR